MVKAKHAFDVSRCMGSLHHEVAGERAVAPFRFVVCCVDIKIDFSRLMGTQSGRERSSELYLSHPFFYFF